MPEPVYTGPPLPFSVNRRRSCVVDMNGIAFYEDELETPLHPCVLAYQAGRAWHEAWHSTLWDY